MTNTPPFAGEGARRVRLGDIASVKAGNVAPKKGLFSERGIPFVRAGSLSRLLDGESPRSLERIDKMTADKLGMQLFPEGTILFAKSGMSCMTGNVYVLKEPCYVVSHLACVAIDNTELTLYLKHYFRWNKPNALVENPSFPSIRLGKIKDMEIRLPDARQIARWVSTLERIEGLMETHEHQLSLLDDLVKSRFVEMFGDPSDNSRNYQVVSIGEILSVQPSNGLYKPQKDYVTDGSGVPIIRIDSFNEEGPNYSALKRLNCTQKETEKYGLRDGDIVVNRVNSIGCMGKTMLIDHLPEVVVFESNMMRMHVEESTMFPRFLRHQMTSDYAKRYFESHAKKAIGQASINQADVKGLKVLVPPYVDQKSFLDFAAEVDKSRFVVQKQIEKLQALYDSLAQEYFG